ncbi:MAG: hypothetical protein LBM21_01595 [Coriobacteriales bacterium]|nr:hypothetical protein [Coriobacteriales bacterium]
MRISNGVVAVLLSAAMAFIAPATAFADGTSGASGSGAAATASTGTQAAATSASSGPAGIANKQEVIYGNLAADGTLGAAYVVNHFKVNTAGTITDYGDYNQVTNLTSLQPLDHTGNEVQVQAQTGDFYYQGDMATPETPWNINIDYTLNGKSVQASDLGGKSGALGIHMTTSQNTAAGIDPAFYDNYMLQITFTFDTDTTNNLVADGSTQAQAGSNTTCVYTVLPKKDADITINADVTNFAMTGIQVAAMPFSMAFDLPDTSSMTDGITQLSQGISQLNSGAGGLAGGSSKIGQALNTIAAALNGSGSDMSALTQLPDELNQAADGLDQLAQGIGAWQTVFDDIDAIPAQSTITSELAAAAGAGVDITKLTQYVTAVETMRGTYEAMKTGQGMPGGQPIPLPSDLAASTTQVSQGLRQAAKALDSADIQGQMSQLSSGLSQLAGQYGTFDTGMQQFASGMSTLNTQTSAMPQQVTDEINSMMSSFTGSGFTPVSFESSQNPNVSLVQFVLTTPDIKAPSNDDSSTSSSSSDDDDNQSFLDRLFALF